MHNWDMMTCFLLDFLKASHYKDELIEENEIIQYMFKVWKDEWEKSSSMDKIKGASLNYKMVI